MYYFLYNPKSNNENNDLNIVIENGAVERQLVMKICLLDLDVRQFAKELEPCDRVLICGGDGTLHHFANNAWGIKFPCPIYAIRSGTGNDFLTDIGQLDNKSLKDIREYLYDCPEGEINDGIKRRFINGVGFGLDGEVCLAVERYKKKHPKKKANYNAIAIKLLALDYKRHSARVTVDGVTRKYKDVWAISTMKGKYYGGGLAVAPDQERESGELSVVVMHSGSKPKALSVFAGFRKGTHVKCREMVDVLKGKDICVEYDSPSVLQIDGEVYLKVTKYRAKTNEVLKEQSIDQAEMADALN